MSTDRPSRKIIQTEKIYTSNLWNLVPRKGLLAGTYSINDWNTYCNERFLNRKQKYTEKDYKKYSGIAIRLYCFANWRLTKGIYRFNKTLWEELLHTDASSLFEAPVKVFSQLPEPCLWVDLRGENGIDGYFASYDQENSCLYLVIARENSTKDHIVVLNFKTKEGVYTKLGEWIDDDFISIDPDSNDSSLSVNMFPIYLSLLYLCSDSPDFGDRKPPVYVPLKKTKQGWKEKPSAYVWNVGLRIGAAIKLFRDRTAAQYPDNGNTGSSKRPHIRRAHWHGYWTGHRHEPEQRKFIYRWIPAISINVKDVNSIPVVIRPVTE